jgi:hypothetical protein
VHKLPDCSETAFALLKTQTDGNVRFLMKNEPVSTTATVIATITKLVQNYTGSQVDGGDPIYAEMCQLFFRSFGHLGIHELKEAFRLGAAGQIPGVKPDNFSAWYGCFSVASLGLILSAYDLYRVSIANRLNQEEKKMASVDQGKQRDEYWRSAEGLDRLAQIRTERISELLTMESPNIDSVTKHDFDVLSELCLINLENFPVERRWQIMVEAQIKVKSEFHNIMIAGRTEVERITASKILDCINSGNQNETFDDKAKIIARRIAVVQWIQDKKAEKVAQ